MQLSEQAIAQNRSYHQSLAREPGSCLETSSRPRTNGFTREAHFKGVRPVIFERTECDLALDTQALCYLEPKLALDISKVYTKLAAFQTLENSFPASAYTPAAYASNGMKGMAVAMQTCLVDVNLLEPAPFALYDETIPELQHAVEE